MITVVLRNAVPGTGMSSLARAQAEIVRTDRRHEVEIDTRRFSPKAAWAVRAAFEL